MPRFAANLSLLFTEHDFKKRFLHASAAGFKGVEYLFPYDYPASELKQLLDENQLQQVLFNLPAGHWAAGERGLACLPDRRQEFQDSVHIALEYAQQLGNSLLHCMAGIKPEGLSNHLALDCYLDNLHYAAQVAANQNCTICIEPINHFDIPNYFLNYSQQATDILLELNLDNLKLQYDLYHAQRMEGHLSYTLERLLPHIAHIQIANTPGRHEPHIGEINYDFIFRLLDHLPYSGWVGCEYIPAQTTRAGLNWLHPYLGLSH